MDYGYNETFLFTELDKKYIDPHGYTIYPVEGPSVLRMKLSQRQLNQLLGQLNGRTEVDGDYFEINLSGHTSKLGGTSEPDKAQSCDCPILTLMSKGCQCGRK